MNYNSLDFTDRTITKDILLSDNNSHKYKSGRHRMTIVGYDNNKDGGAFLVLNSWKDIVFTDKCLKTGYYGDWWGGKNGAPEGCFWLSYDVLDNDAKYSEITHNDKQLKNENIVYLFGALANTKDSKISNKESILYEFTGHEYGNGNVKYNSTELGTDGWFGTNWLGDVAVVKLKNESSIEYNKKIIPQNGTIEIEFKVDKSDFTHTLILPIL